MKVGKYNINAKNVRSFIVGNSRKIASEMGLMTIPSHEEDQILMRMMLCSDCNANGSCRLCGCETPNMFFDPLKLDASGKWGKMLDKDQFDNLMGKTIKRKKANIEKLEDLPDASLKKLMNAYRQYYQESDEMMFYIELDETNRELGTVNLDSENPVVFTIENTLAFPIRISKITVGCGCTTISSWPNGDIQSNDKFDITVMFKGASIGRFKKSINIHFEDPRILPIHLTVSGRVAIMDSSTPPAEASTQEAIMSQEGDTMSF